MIDRTEAIFARFQSIASVRHVYHLASEHLLHHA